MRFAPITYKECSILAFNKLYMMTFNILKCFLQEYGSVTILLNPLPKELVQRFAGLQYIMLTECELMSMAETAWRTLSLSRRFSSWCLIACVVEIIHHHTLTIHVMWG